MAAKTSESAEEYAFSSINFSDITNPIVGFEVGLTGALKTLVDAHNALMHGMARAKQTLDPLMEESGHVSRRLRALEDGQRVQADQLRRELQQAIGECTSKAEFEKTIFELRNGQAEVRQTCSSLIIDKVNAAEEKQKKAWQEELASFDTKFMDLMNAQEQSLEKVAADQAEQGIQQSSMLVEQHKMNESTIPRLRSEIIARVEGLEAGLSDRVDLQGARIQKLEKRSAEHTVEMEKLPGSLQKIFKALEQRALASKLPTLETSIAETEKKATAGLGTLGDQVAELESQIKLARQALAEQMSRIQEELRDAANIEVRKAWADGGERVTLLEQRLAETQQAHKSFLEQVGKEIRGSRADLSSCREWASKRIDSLAEAIKGLESGRQQIQVRGEVRGISNVSDASVDGLTRKLNDMRTTIGERQDKCDEAVKNITRVVKHLGQTSDLKTMGAAGEDFAAGISSSCISCGRNRSLSPFPRSPSPPLEISGVGRLQNSSPSRSNLDRQGVATESRSSPISSWSGAAHDSSASRSRPTSARQRSGDGESNSNISGTLVAGAAHTACRAVGGTSYFPGAAIAGSTSSPRKQPRPYSATRRSGNT